MHIIKDVIQCQVLNTFMRKVFILILALLGVSCLGCTTPKEYHGEPPKWLDGLTGSGSRLPAAPGPVPPPSNIIPDQPHWINGETEAGTLEEVQSILPLERDSKQRELKDENIFNPTSIIEQLRYSAFGYSVPKEANIDDDVEITMKINPLLTVKEIEEELPMGERTTGKIQISRVVQAKLDSRDFDITNITPDRQVIIGGRNTTWRWSLKAKTPGPNKLVKITISAIVLVDGERTESYIDTYNGVIKINITPGQRINRWLKDNWQWAWGALLIPILGFFYNKRKKKR